jgi:GAF domain-containing protein
VLDVDAAGIMLAAPDGGLRVMASSSEGMRVLELFELQSEQGPCLDCYRTGQPVVHQDLSAADGRWPRFAVEALEAGFRSAGALPMRLRGHLIGALNLFYDKPGGMKQADIDAAQALADVATIAILQHRAAIDAQVLNAQLNHALQSRVVIEQAKGVIAERGGLDMGQAFSTLRSYARTHNRLLADVARDVVEGKLNPGALDRPPRATPR